MQVNFKTTDVGPVVHLLHVWSGDNIGSRYSDFGDRSKMRRGSDQTVQCSSTGQHYHPYRSSAPHRSWSRALRRWTFMTMVIALIRIASGFQILKLAQVFTSASAPKCDAAICASRCNRHSILMLSTNSNVSKDPTTCQYQKPYRLQGATTFQNKSGVTVTTSNTGHTLSTDVPKAMGGQHDDRQWLSHGRGLD